MKFLQTRKIPRGMSFWYDVLDWLGGYPFEVSTPQQVFNFYKSRKFKLIQLKRLAEKLVVMSMFLVFKSELV